MIELSEVSESRGTKRVFLSYLEDNNEVINGFVDLIQQTDTTIIFDTTKNRITIPMSRVLKIKEARGDSNDSD